MSDVADPFEPSPTQLSMSAPRPERLGGRIVATIGVALFVVVGAAGVLDVLAPQRSNAPEEASEAARRSLRALAFPRPVTSPARDRALGLVEAEMRASGAVVTRERGVVTQGNAFVFTDDAVAVVPGASPQDHARVFVVAHADSVPHTDAAGDDAFGAAVALEALRRVKAAPPLAGDVVVIVTGQEEVCTRCAAAIHARDNTAAPPDVVVNIDSGGTQGPVAIYESRPGNEAVFAAGGAVTALFASSFVDGFTRVFMTDSGRTELASFAKSRGDEGATGVGIGFLGGRRCYHQACDDVAHLDMDALPVAVDAVVDLVTHAASSPRAARRDDALLVHVPKRLLILPHAAGFALVGLVAALGLVAVMMGSFRRFLDLVLGLLALPCALVVAGVVGAAVHFILAASLGAVAVAQAPLVTTAAELCAFAAAVLTVPLFGRNRTSAFAAGTASWCMFATIAAFLAARELGAITALFCLPAAIGAVLAGVVGPRVAAAPLALGVLGAYLCTQAITLLAITAGDVDDITAALFAGLLCAFGAAVFLGPALVRAFPAVPGVLALACVVAAAGVVVACVQRGAYDVAHPRPASLAYLQTPRGSYLFSVDDPPSTYVLDRLGIRAEKMLVDDLSPGVVPMTPALALAVADAQLAAPTLRTLSVAPFAGGKTWRVELASSRDARDLRLVVKSHADARPRAIRMADDADVAVACARDTAAPCAARFIGARGPLVVDVEIAGDAAPAVTLVDAAFGLPRELDPKWPPQVTPAPGGDRAFVSLDATLVPPSVR